MSTLRLEIDAILNDGSLDYEEKGKRLAKLVTQKELNKILPKPQDVPRLKEPLQPKTNGMKTLQLSIYNVYFDAIAAGTKKVEFREYKEYYINKCTYVENGIRYLRPFDAIVFYVGRGQNAKSMTVSLTDITCDGKYLMFHLGKILYPAQ